MRKAKIEKTRVVKKIYRTRLNKYSNLYLFNNYSFAQKITEFLQCSREQRSK